MADMSMARLHEWMVILYAISLVFYFIDYLNKDKLAHRSAFWILSCVYLMQTVFLVMYIVETKRFPILSLFEGIYFYAWLLITLSIVLHLFFKVDSAIFFLNVIGFILMTIHTFAPVQIHTSPIGETLITELLFIHITFAILSYVAFAMSFVSSILYLLIYKILKQRKWSKQFARLPSLQQADTGIMVSLLTGIPFLLISLILGVQFAYTGLEEWSVFDMKIIGSFLLLLIYSAVLVLRKSNKLIGNQYAWVNIYAFLFVIINFFLGSSLSEFHFWM
ncbi:cytochrome C assembly family protein [Sporosarcina sp. CAU 1771]